MTDKFTTPLKYVETGEDSWIGNPMVELTEDFVYKFGNYSDPKWIITVKSGFKTDFATIPKFLHFWFKPNGKWAKAAVIHDWLWEDATTWSEYNVADLVFLEAMEVLKVNWFVRGLFYWVVRIVGAIKRLYAKIF